MKNCLVPVDFFMFDKLSATLNVTTIMNFTHTQIGGDMGGQKYLLPILLAILWY